MSDKCAEGVEGCPCRTSHKHAKSERPDAAPPTLDDILRWLVKEAAHWEGARPEGLDIQRRYQTNLVWHRLTEWRDTGTEPNHGLE